MGQEVLAKALGVSRGSVSNIENGRHRVFLDQVLIIAEVLKVCPADLLPNPTEVEYPVVETAAGAQIKASQDELRQLARAALDQAVIEHSGRRRGPA